MENNIRHKQTTDTYEITLNGTPTEAAFAIGCLMEASDKCGCLSFTAEAPNTGRITIKTEGTREQAKNTLRELYEAEVIDCDHEFTEDVPVDDTRWIGNDGEVHARSNPDAIRCQICGKYYNPAEETWEDE